MGAEGVLLVAKPGSEETLEGGWGEKRVVSEVVDDGDGFVGVVGSVGRPRPRSDLFF